MSKALSQNVKGQAPALSPADYDKKCPFDKLSSIKKLNDPRFGEISIIQDPQTKAFYACKELKFTDQKSIGGAILDARSRLELKHPHLVTLLDYSVMKQSELCSTFYIIKLFYEYPRSDLKKEHIERTKRNERFTGDELRDILNQQNQVLEHLHLNGKFHGDMQPMMISYDKELQTTKLIDRFDLNTVDKLKLNQKNKLVSGQGLYISPQSLNGLGKGNLKYEVDPNKEDFYALGLTILELGNQRPINDIYDSKNKTMNPDALKKHIDEFNVNYGQANPELVHTIAGMTNIDENNRFAATHVVHTQEGDNIVNVITVKAQPVPMDGVSLFDSGILKQHSQYEHKDDQQEDNSLKNQNFQKQEAPVHHVVQNQPHTFSETNGVVFNAEDAQDKGQDNSNSYYHNTSYANHSYNQNPNSTQDSYQNGMPTTYHHTSTYNYHQAHSEAPTEIVYQQPAQTTHNYVVNSTPYQASYNAPAYSFVNHSNNSNVVYSSPPENNSYYRPVEHYVNSSLPSQNSDTSNVIYLPQGNYEQAQNTSTFIPGNVNEQVSGLKLIKTYLDHSKATDQPNH